jgi:hypothetical protein
MSTYNTGNAIGGVEDAASAETTSFSPSGTDRYIFGGTVAGGFGGAVDTSSFKYGGSSGTDLTQIGTDVTNGNPITLTAWGGAGPTGSTTAYSGYAAGAQSSAIAAVCYTGVASIGTSASTTNTDSAGGNAFYDMEVTVTGCTSGQNVVAVFAGSSTSVDITGFSALSGTTLRQSAVAELALNGIAIAEKVAAGSSVTLNVRMSVAAAASGGGLSYAALGVELQDASSGLTLTAESGTYNLTGQTANTLYARIMAAAQGTYALTGVDALLVKSGSYSFSAEPGAYTLVGATALVDVSMNAEAGTYTLTGQDATVSYAPFSNPTLTADAGTYALSGQVANLLRGMRLTADQGIYSLTGRQAGLSWSGAPTSTGYAVRRMSLSYLKMGL